MIIMKRMMTGMAVVFAMLTGSAALAQVASDNAGNYAGGWTNGSNGGSGFGAWNLDVNQDGTTFWAGAFIGNPTNAGITAFGTEAFGLYANPGASAASVVASRSFSSALTVGQTFSLQWAANWDTDTANRKGFRIYSGGGTNGTLLAEISMNGYPGPIEINSGSGFTNTGIAYGTGPMTWKMKLLDSTTLQLTSTARDGSTPVVYTTNLTVASAPDSFAVFAGAMKRTEPADDARQPYFNNFEITDADALAFTAGVATPGALGDIAFTLVRSSGGGVDDDIVLSSDNSSAVTVPSAVVFDGSDTLVFTGTVVSLSSGAAVITASNVTSGASATYTVTPIAPSLEITGPTYLNEGAKATYVLTRSLSVGDTVYLGSDDPSLVDVPVSVTFVGAATEATFQITATALADTDVVTLSATNTDAADTYEVVGVAAPAGIYDDASYYDSSWYNGDNRGAGFGDWIITNNNGGVYIGSATNQASNHAALDVGGVSFGMYGQGFSDAVRPLDAVIGIGDTLTFSVGFRYDNGNRGFRLQTSGSDVFELNINASGYQWTGGNTNAPSPWQDGASSPVRENGIVLDVEITGTATGFDYDISSAQDTNLVIAGSVVAAAVDAVKFFVYGAESGTDSDFFFNTLAGTDVPDPDALSVTGIDAMALITNVFSVSRTGSTNDAVTVTLTSSDTNVLTVPASVEVPAGQTSMTFEVVGTGLGFATIDLTATGFDATDYSVEVFDIAYDDTQYYGGIWTNEANGGGGFGAWALFNNNDPATNRAAGSFIGSSLSGGPQVNDRNGQAFGLYANGDAAPLSEAFRSFADLQPGQSVSVEIGVNFRNGSKGVQFWHDDGASNLTALLEIGAYTDDYWFENKSSGSAALDLGWEYAADSAIEVTVSRLTNDFYSVLILRSGSASQSNLINNVVLTSAPNTVRFYAYSNDAGDDANNLYFNSLALFTGTIGEVIPTLTVSGPTFLMENGIATYTLTREGGVAEEVFLSSSDPASLTVPGSVTFGASENTIQFNANGLGVATDVLITATNADVISNNYAVDVVAAPTNMIDVAANYDNSWFDGDKSGKGFGAWTLNVTPAAGFAGVFIGNPADAGISGMDAQSFGFYANPVGSGANAEISRSLDNALTVGQTFSFQWGLNFDSNDAASNRGLNLNAGATQLVNINMGASSTLTINGSPMLTNYGVNAFTVECTLLSATELRVQVQVGRDGSEVYDDTIVVAGAPDNFTFYFNGTTTEAERQMYLNNFAITEGGGTTLPEDATANGLTLVGGQPTVAITAEAGLYYYLVYAIVPLQDISVNPINLSQWTVADSENPVAAGPITLTDASAAVASRIYGVLIRSEPID